jgi:zinc/manganese transport system permease protein
MNSDGLDFAILAPAFVAGMLVLLSHVPLGREVIKRGIIFIDLAIAQIAGLGVIIASYMGLDTHGFEVQMVAVASALAGAFILSSCERIFGQYQEALIGVSFVLAASASIILLADNPQGGEHLKELLVGQILWVEWQQLLAPALIAAVILFVAYAKPTLFQRSHFYLFFAVSVTASVQLVGVYLVFASLILPALVTIKIPATARAYALGFLVGLGGYGLGLILSALFDLPSGAVIVWTMALLSAAMAMLIRARY